MASHNEAPEYCKTITQNELIKQNESDETTEIKGPAKKVMRVDLDGDRNLIRITFI